MADFPNIEHYKGDTFNEMPFSIKRNNTAVDLTDTIIRMQLRKEFGGIVYLSLTSVASAGITIINAVGGLFKINEQIINIDAGDYYYDIELNENGVINTYIKGIFTITNDVTR